MSTDPLDVLRERCARTLSPHDAVALVEAMCRARLLEPIDPDARRALDYGTFAPFVHERERERLGAGHVSGVAFWRQHGTMLDIVVHHDLIEWGLVGWRLFKQSDSILWDTPDHDPTSFGTQRVKTHTRVHQTCSGSVPATPNYLLEPLPGDPPPAPRRQLLSLPPLPNIDLAHDHTFPHDDADLILADFGPLLLPDLQALAQPNTSPLARAGTMRLLDTLLFDAEASPPKDHPPTELRSTTNGHFTLTCAYHGEVWRQRSTSRMSYDAELTLTVSPTDWSFERLVTFRDIAFGTETS